MDCPPPLEHQGPFEFRESCRPHAPFQSKLTKGESPKSCANRNSSQTLGSPPRGHGDENSVAELLAQSETKSRVPASFPWSASHLKPVPDPHLEPIQNPHRRPIMDERDHQKLNELPQRQARVDRSPQRSVCWPLAHPSRASLQQRSGWRAGIGLEATRFRAGLKEGAAGRSKKQQAAVQAVPLRSSSFSEGRALTGAEGEVTDVVDARVGLGKGMARF